MNKKILFILLIIASLASGCAKAEGQGDRGSADVAGGDKNNTSEEEQVKERIYYLLDNCVGQRYYDEDIYTIVEEEAQGYFAGTKSLEQTVATIQNRVQLYIDEKR